MRSSFQFSAVAINVRLPFRRAMAGLLLLVLSAIAHGAASEPARSFDLPAGAAGERLLQFSEQAGQQVLFSTELVRDVETTAVKGDLVPKAALEKMFAGSALTVVADEATGALQVRRDSAPPSAPVVLPPLSVTSRGTPWRLAETPGFTFLSHCSDAVTKGYMQGMNRALRILELLVPAEFLLKADLSQIIILSPHGEGTSSMSQNLLNNFSDAPEPTTSSSGPVNLMNASALDRLDRMVLAQTGLRVVRDMELIDKDRSATFVAVRESTFDGSKLFVRAAHFEYLLQARRPALPAWVVAGAMKLYSDERNALQHDGIDLAGLRWLSAVESRRVGTDAKVRAQALMPMDEFMKAPASAQRDAQAALFLRWSVDSWVHGRESDYTKSNRAAKGGRTAQPNREAFWKFVARAAVDPVSEAMFQECFGLNYEEMRARLTDYLRDAVRVPIRLRLANIPELSLPALRDASPSEVSRLKGDWERLTAGFVKERHPQYAQSYAFQARATLMQAYRDGVRDPGALAVIGLYECNFGNDEAARPFLEAAVAAKVIRPQAYFELARLRYAEAKGAPAGRLNRLSAEQANSVTELLRAGHAQSPPLREMYDLAAVAWSNSDVALTRRELALLDEGLRFFPRDSDLHYKAAVVNAVQGYRVETTALVERGLKIARENEDRGRFLDILTKVDSENAMQPLDTFRYVERTTPKGAFEAIVWAANIGADAALTSALHLSGETRDRANALVKEFSTIGTLAERAEYGSPEKLAALSYKDFFRGVTGIQVLEQSQVDDGPVNLEVRLRRQDDTINLVTFAFQTGPGGWQLTVPRDHLDQFRSRLAGRQMAAAALGGKPAASSPREPEVLVISDLMAEVPEQLRPHPGKPVYYHILSKSESDIGSIVANDPRADSAAVEREVIRALAEQGYMQTGPRGPRSGLAIVIQWGSANLDIDEMTVPAPPPPPPPPGGPDDTAPPPPETETITFAFGRREMMMLVGADKANQNILSPSDAAQINAALQERRSYVFVGAFDAQSVQRKKPKLLWRTRMSIGSLHHTLPDSLAAMLASGAPLFGQNIDRPVFVREKDRNAEVQVGTPTVVPEAAAAPQPR